MSSRGNQSEMKILASEIENMKINAMVKRDLDRDDKLESTAGNLEMNSTNQTTSLLDLNSDCIREIFKFLKPLELCSITEASTTTASTHFKVIARDIFEKSHKIWNDRKSETSIDEIRRIFSNFGSSISEVLIGDEYSGGQDRNENLLDLVIEFCSTLESLSIENYKIPEKQIVTLMPLISRLEKLTLTRVTIESTVNDLFGNCKSLVELRVYNCEETPIFETTFTKLTRFTCEHPCEYFKLEDFIIRHKNLESIVICSRDPWFSYMPLIADNCKHLKTLDISVTDYDEDQREYGSAIESILRMEHLKELRIDGCSYKNVTQLIRGLAPLKTLECLSLDNVECDSKFMPALTELQKLRELNLYWCYNLSNVNQLCNLTQLTNLYISQRACENIDFDMVQLITRLINLRKFTFEGNSFRMTKNMYLKIVNIVQERVLRSQHRLEIWCETDDDITDLQIFRNYSHIVQIHRFN